MPPKVHQICKASTEVFPHCCLPKHQLKCYAHVVNLVLADPTEVAISSGSLFSLVNDVAVFFRKSYQRMNVLERGSQVVGTSTFPLLEKYGGGPRMLQ